MTGPRMWGLVAEFESPDALLAAAHRVREAGYRRIDACVPFRRKKTFPKIARSSKALDDRMRAKWAKDLPKGF